MTGILFDLNTLVKHIDDLTQQVGQTETEFVYNVFRTRDAYTVKKILELSNSQAAWVQMAFYGGYFSMALPAAIFIRKYNYKKGILLGLILYALGALMFYPAAITEQFWFFCLGLYILTFGLATTLSNNLSITFPC